MLTMRIIVGLVVVILASVAAQELFKALVPMLPYFVGMGIAIVVIAGVINRMRHF